MKPFILSGSFASGFAMALMAKDVRTAADMAQQLGVAAEGAGRADRTLGRSRRQHKAQPPTTPKSTAIWPRAAGSG